ncbi:3-dehydroquinate synthase [Bulleidia sp. zg-1006]|uniref:3-dehydroquinate synthase n=1 Tax=Bulleidia sp. zg-1006 TaxID=2806552 RepID=UPI001939C790|nr:3-dehydroquinate synthase [Bulleidia sp. zg-1006]QRG86288.1 3-dehydroquinate synthase [Bulleidia sp. zg-1006]
MKKIDVKIPNKSYSIYLEDGLLAHLNTYLNTQKRYIIISDTGVPKKWKDLILDQLSNTALIEFEQGEKHKSLETYSFLLKKLVSLKVTRKDMILALGGGVVGDLAGFVASTYRRGIAYIQIPTTTLSMVDSSIGGKTAIDLEGYKNIVGTFYQPELVLIDPLVLKTLPVRQVYNGLIEALKAGLIADSSLFQLFEQDEWVMEDIIEKSLFVKKKIVEKDEKELGLRMILNFGHTWGHAYEAYAKGKLLHGEAVGLGMLEMLEEPLKTRLQRVLKKMNCPIHYEVNREKLLPYMEQDKKVNSAGISIVLVKQLGEATIQTISFSELERMVVCPTISVK